MTKFRFAVLACLCLCFAIICSAQAPTSRWSEQRANDWYAQQPWLVGSNYIPATAINELEMWQADTFDPRRIDLELGWAQSIGLNTMRVFLHDLLWQQDAAGFQKRIDTFLTIAHKHHIRILFVLFDSCWNPARISANNALHVPECIIPVGYRVPVPRLSATPRNSRASKLTSKASSVPSPRIPAFSVGMCGMNRAA